MREIKVGILGFGTVGSGTVKILQENADAISARIGAKLVVSRVAVRDLSKPRDVVFASSAITDDPREVTDDPEIEIVAELIGGVEPARSLVERAIANGKNIVTANKEMVAKVGHDLRMAAQTSGKDFFMEASVAGGIPIIATLGESLAGNRIREIAGIVNGTTNYILTKMTEEGAAFEKVLAEAQALGYAEAEPSSDVDGYDAQYKIAILASLAFGSRVNVEEVYVEGIRDISPRDIFVAKELGYRIKLLATAQGTPNGMRVRVNPALLPLKHPLATVDGVFNGVFVRGDAVGDLTLIGRGAGSLPTGSAVVGDIVHCARNIIAGATGRVPYTTSDDLPMLPAVSSWSKYYARVRVLDRPKALASIAHILATTTFPSSPSSSVPCRTRKPRSSGSRMKCASAMSRRP
jgi:homoserine dehydrogenase